MAHQFEMRAFHTYFGPKMHFPLFFYFFGFFEHAMQCYTQERRKKLQKRKNRDSNKAKDQKY